MNMTAKDFLKNTFLIIKSVYRNWQKLTEYGAEFVMPDNYDLSFIERFRDGWSKNWESDFNQPDCFHPDNHFQWYDKESIFKGPNGLFLKSVRKPRYFDSINKIIPNAIGAVASRQAWKYGVFVFEAKMPYGRWLWPAIWLRGSTKWPPEIDVAECWSKDNLNCNKPTTNIHFGVGGIHNQYKSLDHVIPNSGFVEYILHWEKEFIRVYYNGYLVYQITDKRSLDDMFEEMKIVFTAGVDNKGNFDQSAWSSFIIKSVEIFQKNKS
jgi:beta-glucanase (GH16 family)